jgi:outer membrane protein OmpA-like peptidoglycan-associated protein
VSINLIDLLTKELTGDALGKIASGVGVSENQVRTAVGGLAPALIGALANKASSGQGLTDLLDLARTSGFDGSKATGLAGLLGSNSLTDLVTKGAPLAASLFGSRHNSIIDWLASFAGVGSKSAGSLLSLAAPLVLSLLGGEARKGGGFTQAVLGQILGSQGSFLRDKAPSGLAAALGLADFSKLGAARPVAAAPVKESGTNWWPWLLIPLLLLLGWWWFSSREPEGTVNPRIAVVNEEGKIVCSASVRDDATKAAILKALQAGFGASATCDITVDRNIRKLPWIPNVDKIIAALKKPGTDFLLDGSTIKLGGWLSAADRKAILDQLNGLLGTGYSFGDAADKAGAYISDAKAKALAALTAIGSAFSAESFTNAMNLAVINFATGSATIPADAQDLIAQAATVLKTAPKGTMIEIGGHTDNVGDAASNLKLSEDRANAVKQALVSAGVDGAMLAAKGYGDTQPTASNDSEYGRFRNRRIQYSVLPAATKK